MPEPVTLGRIDESVALAAGPPRRICRQVERVPAPATPRALDPPAFERTARPCDEPEGERAGERPLPARRQLARVDGPEHVVDVQYVAFLDEVLVPLGPLLAQESGCQHTHSG